MQTTGFETILCPVDFSELSAHALRHAAQIASRCRSSVVAVYANWFEVPPYFTEGRVAEFQKQFQDSFSEAERSLRAFVESALGEAADAVETRVREGQPADVIREMAVNTHADLIVMGTHGRSGFNRWTLGSVAERVLRESQVPLLTVRSSPRAPVGHILCPVDDTDESHHAFTIATQFGVCFSAAVTALYVHEAGSTGRRPDLCQWIPAEARTHCNIRELVRHGDPAQEIVAVASEEAYDLLVLGAPRRRFFDGMVLGTAALRAVRHAACPVLTVGGRGMADRD